MDFNYSDDLVSDLHKDARGFRPGEYFWEEWTQSPDEIKQQIWDGLISELNENNKITEERERVALVSLRHRVAKTMKVFDCNWKDAMKILVEADGEDINCSQGFGFFLFNHDIGYTDRQNIMKLYKEGA